MARKNRFPLMQRVNNDWTPMEITSPHSDAVLMSRADNDTLEETAHLLRAPANARRLTEDALRDPPQESAIPNPSGICSPAHGHAGSCPAG